MRKWIGLTVALLTASIIFAQESSKINLGAYLENNGEAYVKVQIDSPKDILVLSQMISVDALDKNEVYAYLNVNTSKKFLELGYEYEILTKPSEHFMPKMYDGTKDNYEWDAYPTYEAYIAMMEQFATDYPEICQVFSIGESNNGRELKFVKISDNVSQDEPEAQFLYIGTIHGDEVTGYVLLLRLIDYLTSNYGTDAEVTDLVNNLEIWINPASNPDGTYHGGNNTVFGAQRGNANYVDMNRNYRDPQDGDHPDGNAWQTETVFYMDLAEANNFVMAANTHGGAEVVNYPWDTWPTLAADDNWWQLVSHEYADTAQFFSPSNYMTGWDDGITNGYQWYTISGGRQDYMNYFQQCREVTLEISDVKLIPENQLDAHWTYNKRSLINYMKQVYYGIKGIVTDSITGEPLRAKVEVLDHDIHQSFVYSREGQGNYHRLIKQGTYDLYFSADGYIPKTFYNVQAYDYDSTILNVQLVAAGLVADFSADNTNIAVGASVQFSQACFGDPDTYEWTFEGGIPATSNEENPQVIYNQEGSFSVSLSITNGSDEISITKEDYIRVSDQYIMDDGEIIACSGVFYDNGGPDADYNNSRDYVMAIKGDPAMENTILTVDFTEFSLEPHATCDYDYLKIYNGSTTNAPLIGTYCGNDSPGLVQSNNADNALTFEFHSDNAVVASGWKAIINCTIIDRVNDLAKNRSLKIFPNPVNNGRLQIQMDINMKEISLYNLTGQLLQSWMAESKEQVLDVSAIHAGIYLIGVKSAEGMIYQKVSIN